MPNKYLLKSVTKVRCLIYLSTNQLIYGYTYFLKSLFGNETRGHAARRAQRI